MHASNIRVHTSTYDYTRPNMVIYRLYTNTLATYKYIGATYDDRKVINMNFCLFISFLHVRRSCLAHTRERAQVPHVRVPHTCAPNCLGQTKVQLRGETVCAVREDVKPIFIGE